MARRLTLVAGGGDLVPHIAAALGRTSDNVQILDLAGRSGELGSSARLASLQNPKELIEAIMAFRTTHLVLAGGVHISDAERDGLVAAFGLAGKIAGGLGDVGLAGVVMLYSKMQGIKLVGAHEVAPELVAPEGHIAGPPTDIGELAAVALRAARAIGAIDLGQAIVLSGKRPIAAEDAGGTDGLLTRVAALRRAGHTGNGRYPLILAKARKPKQPSFADLPAIGPDTIINAAAAGISVIVVEARASLLLERAKIEAEATTRGVSVIGIRHG